MRHILEARQFDPERLGEVFEQAESFERDMESDAARRGLAGRYTGRILVNLFYEASTRTRMSFGMAARHLGMEVEGTENAMVFSSVAKGETLEDTIQVLNAYRPSIIVLRHHETGAANIAASVSEAPIINAGDGKGEHPSQALLDVYTIQKHFGRLHDLNVVLGGDLARGRTVRSLAQLLSMYPGNTLQFVSIPELGMGDDIKTHLRAVGTEYVETDDMIGALRDADVVYWTRLQSERPEAGPEGESEGERQSRLESIARMEAIARRFVIDQSALQVMKQNSIIMHPLPRVGEIDHTVDGDPRAVYFEQAGNGLFVRMALIDGIMRQTT